jgi:hypothetical protein
MGFFNVSIDMYEQKGINTSDNIPRRNQEILKQVQHDIGGTFYKGGTFYLRFRGGDPGSSPGMTETSVPLSYYHHNTSTCSIPRRYQEMLD